MAFTQTCKAIALHDTILSAQCRTEDDPWKTSYLDLNQHLGNRNGSFWLSGRHYFDTATSVRLDGHILRALLRRLDGEYNEASLDLTLCLENVAGNLRFKKPNEHLLSSCSGFVLKGSVLEALCLGKTGKMHSSSIDLTECYSNDDGEFFPGAKNFARTARKLAVRVTDNGLLLSAELRTRARTWVEAETDLALRIANKDGLGRLVFVDYDVRADNEHSLTGFFKRMPCVDYIVEDIRAKSDADRARRVLEHCAKSSAVAVSLILCARCGGPVAVSISAGLTHPIFILSDTPIPIDDQELKLQFEQAIIGRYLQSTLRTVLPAGAAAAIANTVSSHSQEEFEAACAEIAAALAERASTAVEPLSNLKSYMFLKMLAETLVRGDLPHEWKASIKKVRDLLNPGAANVKDKKKEREGHAMSRSHSARSSQRPTPTTATASHTRAASQTRSVPPPVAVPAPTSALSTKISPPLPYSPENACMRSDSSERPSSSSSSNSNPLLSANRSDNMSASTSSPSFASWRARHDGLSAPLIPTTSPPVSATATTARAQSTSPANVIQGQVAERQTPSLGFGGVQRSDNQVHSAYSSYS